MVHESRASISCSVIACSPVRSRIAEVELLEVGNRVLGAERDGVEVVLHARGEVEVDQIGEVLLQQLHHRERGEGRHQRVALLDHVLALLDGLDDRGVGRRPADAAGLELLDQRRLGVARRRLRGVVARLEAPRLELVVARDARQQHLLLRELALGVVRAFGVGAQETGELDGLAASLEDGLDRTRRLRRCRRAVAAARRAPSPKCDARAPPPSGRPWCASRSARRAAARRPRAGARARAASRTRSRGGSPRAPPARS